MLYADFNGSGPLLPEVKNYLLERIEQGPYANPNSIHVLGRKINMAIEKARRVCAEVLGAKPNQIIFNSGSSEGISAIYHSLLNDKKEGKDTIITSGIEHSAVVEASSFYAERGYQIVKVKTQSNGQIDLDDLTSLLKEFGNRTALVSIMAANNETGVIQPIQEIRNLTDQYQLPFFSDTTQYIGKTSFNFASSGLDFAVLSGHKVGALIGSGILLAKDPEKLIPHVFGGGQEKGLRGGTQNYIGIETLAVALNQVKQKEESLNDLKKRREDFETKIKQMIPEARIIGEEAPRLAGTTLLSIPGIHGQAVQIELESQEIFVSTSSACSDNEPETSKVLKSMNIDDNVGRGVVRISLCGQSSPESYQKIYEGLQKAYKKLKKIESY